MKKQLSFPFAERPKQTCLCGQPKPNGHVVCRACFLAAPHEARAGLASYLVPTKRAAIRQLLDFAASRSH